MAITYDPNKNVSNIQKHGLSFEDVRNLEWEEAYTWIDDRFDYSEERISALVPNGGTTLFRYIYPQTGHDADYYFPKGKLQGI